MNIASPIAFHSQLVSISSSSYGDIPGSQPSWSGANLRDQGRRHDIGKPSLLAETGLGQWHTLNTPGEKPIRKMFSPRETPVYAEPIVYGARPQTSYYERRAQTADCDYRRSIRAIPDPGPLRIEKPLGKRAMPEPKPSGPNSQGKKQIPEARFRESNRLSEPLLPRLGRPEGISNLRESENEFSYERALGRKIRVDTNSLKGQGFAGDRSGGFGPKARPEDDPFFFKSLKDTPTFIRFCSTLPPNRSTVSCHERRAQQQRSQIEHERERMKAEVATLTFEVSDD